MEEEQNEPKVVVLSSKKLDEIFTDAERYRELRRIWTAIIEGERRLTDSCSPRLDSISRELADRLQIFDDEVRMIGATLVKGTVLDETKPVDQE